MLRLSARFFLPLTAVNETGQWPLDLLTACQPASASQPHVCLLVVALRIWGIFTDFFLLRGGEFWRISRSVRYALGYSDTIIICLVYRQCVQYVVCVPMSQV